MPATVLRATIGAILQAIETRLVTRGVVPAANLVKWVPPGMQPATLDSGFDLLLIVRGLTAPPIPSWATGAGKTATKITRRIDVQPRTEMLLDEPDRVKTWLLGSSPDQGYLPLEESVIDALHLWTPLDAYSNELTCCPLHLLVSADPIKQQTGKQASGWGYGAVSFECQYLAALTQTFT